MSQLFIAKDSLFAVDANAGTKTYTIETGGFPTGTGSIGADNKTLTVTKAGTFAIGLATAATSTHAAGAKVTATLTVNKGSQAAPSGLGKTDVTIHGGSDGTITGVSTGMEYKLSSNPNYTAISGTTVTGLAAGAYLVRFAETDLYNVSPDASISVSEPPADVTPLTRVLTVTAPTFAAADYGYARPAAKAITISNSGNSAATITSVTVSATDFEIAGSGATVAAGSQISTWTIQPKAGLATGTHTATITVTYNGTGGATATANVSFTVNPSISTYSVTVAPTTNGSVSASPTTAAAGETVTLTVTPATGYKLDAISITPTVETLHATSLPNTYEFTMPASNVTVTFTINTGIGEVQSQAFRAHVKDGLLHGGGLTAGKLWSVYSISGVLLYQNISGGDEADVHLPVRGVYIVRSGAHTVKVIY